jgi:hypothetical protein
LLRRGHELCFGLEITMFYAIRLLCNTRYDFFVLLATVESSY